MKLNGIECLVEALDHNINGGIPLKEYKSTYTDGSVQCMIAIPSLPDNFRVRIKSSKFIADSVCAYVFIDGKYQSNRLQTERRLPAEDGSDMLHMSLNAKEVMKQGGFKMSKRDGYREFWKKGWKFEDLGCGKLLNEEVCDGNEHLC